MHHQVIQATEQSLAQESRPETLVLAPSSACLFWPGASQCLKISSLPYFLLNKKEVLMRKENPFQHFLTSRGETL